MDITIWLLGALELFILLLGGLFISGFTRDDAELSLLSNMSFLASMAALIFYKNQLLGHMGIYVETLSIVFMLIDIRNILSDHPDNNHLINNEINNLINPLVPMIRRHVSLRIIFLVFFVVIAVVLVFPQLANQLGIPKDVFLQWLNKYNIQ